MMDTTVQRAIQGDPDAIGQLYERYHLPLRRYLYRRVPPDDVDDLLSEVWLQALRSLPTYEDRGYPFSAWLYRIAQARAIDCTRKTRRQRLLPLLDTHAVAGPETHIDRWDAHAALPQLLARLPTPEQRTVIVRRFLLDQSVDEVAAAMGLSKGATKALQHRALTALHTPAAPVDPPAPAAPIADAWRGRPKREESMQRSLSPTPAAPPPVLRFDPHETGLRRWLGPLECALMEICWRELRSLECAALHRHINAGRDVPLAPTTVDTTLRKMTEKGLLTRQKTDGPYRYAPVCDRATFEATQIAAIHAALGNGVVHD